MSSYLQIANKSVFFVCAAIVIGIVLFQSVLFIRLAFQEGRRRGISQRKMWTAIRTGAVSSIVPTLAIVVALIAMVPSLGIPIPWMRLSIIGSAPYELMAAGIGAKAMGVVALGSEGYTQEVFASSILTMCFGSIWAISIVVLFLRKIKKRYSVTIQKSDRAWQSILINAAFLGVFSIFIAEPLTTGGLPLITLLSGGLLMTFFAILIFKKGLKWLKELALPLSMIGAMVSAVIFANFIF